MQLGFPLILKPNAQVIETWCHKFEIIGHALGLALSLLLSTGVNWALGLVLTPLVLLRGLPLRLLWLRNHLVYHHLRRGCYTYAYAYDMSNVGMIYKNYK